MAELLSYDEPWKRITALVKKQPKRCCVAVAYFGTGASKLLPLRAGSTLVVDVSDRAVRSGQTNPSELLRLVKKGVNAYSVHNLHAKVFVIDGHAVVGSTNVSNASAHGLVEAVVETNDRTVAAACRRFIMDLRAEPATPEHLKGLQKLWRPPRFGRGGAAKTKSEQTVAEHDTLWIIPMEYTTYSKEDEKAKVRGHAKAKRRIRSLSLYRLDDFKLDAGWMNTLKANDLVIQIVDEGKGRHMVTPPDRVLDIEPSTKGHARPAIVSVESCRKWRRKNLEAVLKKLPPSGRVLEKTEDALTINDGLLAHALMGLWLRQRV